MVLVNAFDGIAAKLDRADELIALVDTAFNEWIAGQPHTAEHHVNKEANADVIIFRETQQIPVRFSVMFGEIIHHTRSALDHLACGLVERAGHLVTTKTAFPIVKSEGKWRREVVRPAAGTPARGPLAGLGVSSRAFKLIDSIQPFHATDAANHPLQSLHELWNQDKHRTLAAASTYSDPEALLDIFTWDPQIDPIRRRAEFRAGQPLRDGQVIATFQFPPGQMPRVTAERRPLTMELAFGDHQKGPRPATRDIVTLVRDVVHQAERLV
jgi:hypothetical protein